LETAALAPDSFDAVWCDAILHHVIAELPCVLDRLTHWARPGALLIFGEPVNFSATLRRIRAMLPIQTDATPDERPLGPAEIAIIRRYVRDLKIRPFGLFSRLDRFLLPRYNYELAAWSRRAASNICAAVDAAVLASPFLQSLAGSAVLYGYPAKS
jgi:SAM-dependent methyltransferase